MNQLETIIKQTQDAYDWVNKLLSSIPYEKWTETPAIIESNVSWQAGHMLVGIYFHSIMVISGHQMEILRQIPMNIYADLFMDDTPKAAAEKVNPEQIYQQLQFMEEKSLAIINALSLEDLEAALAPSPTPHPIAKNKFEALDWNIKHTLWHCGQVGMIKRVVDKRFDFGLKR